MNLMRAVRMGCAGAAIVAAAACSNSPTTPSSAAYSQTDLRVGSGVAATSTSTVTVDYTGWLYDPTKVDGKGLEFGTSTGGEPLTFTLGSSTVIPGWDRGVPGMQVGGLRRLVIPPSLGYGGVRFGIIPPNATLVFEVELKAIQ